MKLSDVQVSSRYTAKVSGRIVTVRVVEIVAVESTRWSNAKTRIEAVNEATGRQVTIRLPQRLRTRVDQTPSGDVPHVVARDARRRASFSLVGQMDTGFVREKLPSCNNMTAWSRTPASSGVSRTIIAQ